MEELVTGGDVADLLGVAPGRVRQLARERPLPEPLGSLRGGGAFGGVLTSSGGSRGRPAAEGRGRGRRHRTGSPLTRPRRRRVLLERPDRADNAAASAPRTRLGTPSQDRRHLSGGSGALSPLTRGVIALDSVEA